MERITFDGDFCDIAMCQEVRGGPLCEDGECSQRKEWYRLKAYEDTELSPEEIKGLLSEIAEAKPYKSFFEDLVAWQKVGEALSHFRHLALLDREGRLVVLPAATVFELAWDAGPGCDMICPLSIDGDGQCDFCDHGQMYVYERECRQEHLKKLGDTVFLSREDAETAREAWLKTVIRTNEQEG